MIVSVWIAETNLIIKLLYSGWHRGPIFAVLFLFAVASLMFYGIVMSYFSRALSITALGVKSVPDNNAVSIPVANPDTNAVFGLFTVAGDPAYPEVFQ